MDTRVRHRRSRHGRQCRLTKTEICLPVSEEQGFGRGCLTRHRFFGREHVPRRLLALIGSSTRSLCWRLELAVRCRKW